MTLVLEEVTDELAGIFGAENVQGLDRLFEPDWVDSDHADAGNVAVEVWNAHKVAMGGGQEEVAVEKRRKAWKSDNVSFLKWFITRRTHLSLARAIGAASSGAISSVAGQEQVDKTPLHLPWFPSKHGPIATKEGWSDRREGVPLERMC
jgi:hypothetical protein